MITGDDRWFQLAQALLTAVQAALTVPVNRAGIVPGAIAWDGADCGALYVAWTRTYLSDQFPHAVEEPLGNCDPALEVTEFILQVVRCSPSGNTSRAPVEADVLTPAALQLARDTQQMINASLGLLCGLKDAQQVEDYMLGEVRPVGPEGALVGAELNLAVSLTR